MKRTCFHLLDFAIFCRISVFCESQETTLNSSSGPALRISGPGSRSAMVRNLRLVAAPSAAAVEIHTVRLCQFSDVINLYKLLHSIDFIDLVSFLFPDAVRKDGEPAIVGCKLFAEGRLGPDDITVLS